MFKWDNLCKAPNHTEPQGMLLVIAFWRQREKKQNWGLKWGACLGYIPCARLFPKTVSQVRFPLCPLTSRTSTSVPLYLQFLISEFEAQNLCAPRLPCLVWWWWEGLACRPCRCPAGLCVLCSSASISWQFISVRLWGPVSSLASQTSSWLTYWWRRNKKHKRYRLSIIIF